MAEVPRVLQRLCESQKTLTRVLIGLNEDDDVRDDVVDLYYDLVDTCYEDYFDGGVLNHRVRPQDDWLPLLNQLRNRIEQFDERVDIYPLLETWCDAYQAYRDWVRHCEFSSEQLGTTWDRLMFGP